MAKHKNKHWWFMIGLLSVALGAPNASIIRASVADISALQFNVYRFAAASLVTAPIIWKHRRKYKAKSLSNTAAGSVFMCIAVLSYVSALKASPASYVTILTLLTPIVFIVLAAKITGEKVSSRSMAGISLAAAGGLVLVALPVAMQQRGDLVFYPLGTMFSLINTVSFPLAIIYFAKANKQGIPMTALMGISAWMLFVVSSIGVVVTGQGLPMPSMSVVIASLYSGILVAVLARSLNISSYEHIGAAVSSSLSYLEALLAIIIPVIVLSETLSVEMVVGGVLILFGVFVAEHHGSRHHKHRHVFRHH